VQALPRLLKGQPIREPARIVLVVLYLRRRIA
jgi:hypothetical protein